MANDGWEDIPQEGWADVPEDGWEDAPTEPEGPSELDSAGRGFAQGASLGLRDEGAGLIDSPMGAMKEIANKFGADFTDDDVRNYRRERDLSRGMDEAARNANPKSYMGGELGGTLATSFVPGLGAAKGAGLLETGLAAARQGAAYGIGSSNAESIGDLALDAGKSGLYGFGGGAAGYGAGKLLEKGASVLGRGAQGAANALDETAENLALKATGATGREAQKFAPDAGRELLDRGLVKFGDDAERIAGRIGDANDAAGAAIQGALEKLDAKGVTANADNVVASLEAELKRMVRDPSQAGTVRKLQGVIDDIKSTGGGQVPISEAELTKRGFNKAAGNWMDPEAGAAGKKAYLGYMDEVERAARKADPVIADVFEEGKKTYGLLKPIQDASQRRAATLNQSPLGGLLDTSAAAVGEIAKGGAGIPVAIARRGIMPRIASMGAVTADSLAKMATQAPEMLGKFSGVLQKAAQRGTQAIAATHFILESSNPEYREMMKKMQGFEGE